MVTSILTWILIGLVIGALARLVVPGKQGISLPTTILIGIAASFLGGILTYVLFDYKNKGGGFPWIPAIVSLVLASLAVGAYTRMQAGRVARTLPRDGLSGSGRAR